MALRSILAIYSGDAAGSGGLGLAVHMARKYDAFLTGIVWRGPSPLEQRFQRYMSKEIVDMLAARDAEVVSEVRDGFLARIEAENLQDRTKFIEIREG